MTWEEFKAEVDRQIEEKKLPKDAEIWYIDVAFPDKHLEVLLDERDRTMRIA